ncbi:membrane-spanning 4-domains subfamily A member 14 [Saccopteryx bilineata]|uniref:membrane-spanning 4-domains subfamily A member 14 n=1 Tax=Saccopteryx bilineata TaxID=59482 RepID=UPI00339034B4
MVSSSEVKRSTHVITVPPSETVLTAFPYGPHSSLLDFLKGEPRVLGTLQILLALIIVSVGSIFAFNYFIFSQRFPLVFYTGYPFWGAFIFMVTGSLTGLNKKEKCLGQGVTTMNVISSLVAVAGITLTLTSFQHQDQYCQLPSFEGICVIGRILFNGILSVLLIISIAELSISVTIASFRSKCWTKSNEIVFFLPLDVTQKSELAMPEHNAVIQFDLQEESSSNYSRRNIQPVFFGGYTFFKLKASKSPLTIHRSEKRGSNVFDTCSLSGSDEQQKNMPPPLKHEKKDELKPLSSILVKRPLEDVTHTDQINSEDLLFAIEQSPKMQTQSLQAETLPFQIIPPRSVKLLQELPPSDSLSQTLSVQTLLSEAPASNVTQPYDLIDQELTYQDTHSQDKLLQDMFPQAQVLPTQVMQFETQSLHAMPAPNVQHLKQQSLDLQPQDQQFTQISYQDLQSEVNLLSQEWKYEKKIKKSLKRRSFEKHSKDLQSPRRKSLDLQIQGQKSPRKRSLDQRIKGWLSPRKRSIDKQVKVKQLSDQKDENQLTQEKQLLKQQFQNKQDEDQQGKEEESPKEQIQNQQTKDPWVQEEPSSEQLNQHLQSQIQKPQAWQTQDLLDKEFLKKKILNKEAQIVHAIPPHHLDQQLEDVPLPDSRDQNKKQKDLRSTGIQNEDMQIDTLPKKDIKLTDMKSLCQNRTDLQSAEDMKPDFHHSSCQSSVYDASSSYYLSNVGSEQDVQQNTSISSTSYREDPTVTTCYPKDQQPSEDSD